MNHFANSFLSILLGWMRTLFASVLSIFQGNSSGVLSWMSKRWFVLAVILILAGLTIDMLIYIIRWKPQYVWRSRLYRLLHHKEYAMAEHQFIEGFDTALTNFNFEDTPIVDLQSHDPNPLDAMDFYHAPPMQDQDPRQDEAAFSSQEEENVPLPIERKRRSGRHGRRNHAARINMRFHLPDLSDSDRYNTIYPEPPVRAREAFHDPVYPAMDPNHSPSPQTSTTKDQKQ